MSIDNVQDITPRKQYVASGGQTVFPYDFPIFDDVDLVVDIDGVIKTITTDYTVSGAGDDNGGNVTLTVGATAGEIVTIYRDIPIERTSDIQQNGPLRSAAINDEFDRLTLVDQQLELATTRAIRVNVNDEADFADLELPSVTSRANKYLVFDANGIPTTSAGTGADSGLREDIASGSAGAVTFVDTVADMKALTGLVDGAVVVTKEYTSGNLGGGEYIYDSTLAVFDEVGAVDADTMPGGFKLRHNGFISVRQAGAVGDGVTNDKTAIRNAISFAETAGVRLISDPDAVHYLGAFSNSGDDPCFLIDFDGFVFDTNNCKFTATASTNIAQASTANQSIFKLQDASNVVLGDFRAEADTVDRTNTIGVVAVHVRNQAANSKNHKIGHISGLRLLSTITASSSNPALYRHSGLVADKLYNLSGYYNVNCADNIDDFSANISSDDIVRSYFVYGVKGHRAKIYSINHNKFTDVLIKRYEYNTKEIHVEYYAENDISSAASISIEHQNDTDNGTIEDVYIDLNVQKSNPANPTLNFVSFTNAGAVRATTNSVTNGIYIRGNTNSTTPTVIQSTISGTNNGENISRLSIARGLLAGLLDYKRFIMLDGSRKRMAISDATGGMSLKFNVSEFKFIPNVGLLTIYAADNATGSAAEFITSIRTVNFSVSSTGLVTINDDNVINNRIVGALGPTVSIPSGLSTFNLTVNINNYTGANRRVRGSLEVYSAFEM